MKKDTLDRLGPLANQNIVYALIVVLFLLYLISGAWAFGIFAGIAIVWVVALEFLKGTHEHGLKNELKETAMALLLALLVWFGAGWLLQTSSPLNAIVSCSMLPNVQRGDMVVLSGDRLDAPVADIGTLEGLGSGADVYELGSKVASVKGSLYSYCAQNADSICRRFVENPERFTESHGPLVIGYEKCDVLFPKTGKVQSAPCVVWVEANGMRYHENVSNDIPVYAPEKDEYYSRVGDIIHRAYLKLNADGKTYFITKGDNNPILDIQVYDEKSGMGNRPVEVGRSKGRILFSIPYLGYFKLFLSPGAFISGEGGCDRYYEKYAPQ